MATEASKVIYDVGMTHKLTKLQDPSGNEANIADIVAGNVTGSGNPTFGNVTATGNITAQAGVLTAGKDAAAGTVTLFPATTASGKTNITMSNNTGNTTTVVNVAAQAAARTYTVPDAKGNGTVSLTSGSNLWIGDIYRSGNLTKNANVTYADVPNLSGNVAVGTYRFRAVLPSTVASGTGGIKYSFHYTNSAALSGMEATGLGYTASAVAVQHSTSTTDNADLFTQAAVVIMTILEGTMVVSTAGTVTVQMAQNTSNGSNTIALDGGSLELTRIA